MGLLELGFLRDHPGRSYLWWLVAVFPVPGAHASPRSGQRQLGQVEISPFKPARANQGLARPAVPTRCVAKPGIPPTRETLVRWGTAEPAAWVTCTHTAISWDRPSCPGRNRDAMEHSLRRVSLGSRHAHPNLSFYLTTFGKCLRDKLLIDRFLGNPSLKGKPLP